jgi:hypothetical protein
MGNVRNLKPILVTFLTGYCFCFGQKQHLGPILVAFFDRFVLGKNNHKLGRESFSERDNPKAGILGGG